MKGSRKKSKGGEQETPEKHVDRCIEELAELIVDEAKEQHHSNLESFELYASRVKSRVHSNMEEFRTRFAKGYKILLEELQKEKQAEEKEPPKPGSIKP